MKALLSMYDVINWESDEGMQVPCWGCGKLFAKNGRGVQLYCDERCRDKAQVKGRTPRCWFCHEPTDGRRDKKFCSGLCSSRFYRKLARIKIERDGMNNKGNCDGCEGYGNCSQRIKLGLWVACEQPDKADLLYMEAFLGEEQKVQAWDLLIYRLRNNKLEKIEVAARPPAVKGIKSVAKEIPKVHFLASYEGLSQERVARPWDI